MIEMLMADLGACQTHDQSPLAHYNQSKVSCHQCRYKDRMPLNGGGE